MKTKISNVLTGLQCKMARIGLGWGVRELAEHAKVSGATIVRLERGEGRQHHATLVTIRQALEAAGAEFIDGDGVRVRKPSAAE
jgi:transcriptional regulator with XRE-family HTH domain